MTEFEKTVIDRLDGILAEMKAAREERADDECKAEEASARFREYIKRRNASLKCK